ncbi:MAG: hypothetical protein CUN55_19300, partial [Phototrophicales bacterium]
MMELVDFLWVAALILVVGLVSKPLAKTPITPPMLYVVFGICVGTALTGWFEIDFENQVMRVLAELTLALVLFADASKINFDALKSTLNWPLRMLSIGLILTTVLGALVAMGLFAQFTIWE